MTYGCLKPDNMVLYVNLIGDLMQLFYIVVYHTYAEDKVVLPHFPTLSKLIIPLPFLSLPSTASEETLP